MTKITFKEENNENLNFIKLGAIIISRDVKDSNKYVIGRVTSVGDVTFNIHVIATNDKIYTNFNAKICIKSTTSKHKLFNGTITIKQ